MSSFLSNLSWGVLDPREIAMRNPVTTDGCLRCLTHSLAHHQATERFRVPSAWAGRDELWAAERSQANSFPCSTARLAFLSACFVTQPLYHRQPGTRSSIVRLPCTIVVSSHFFPLTSYPFGTHYCPPNSEHIVRARKSSPPCAVIGLVPFVFAPT